MPRTADDVEDFFLFLTTCARMSLLNAFDQDWFNAFIPGARALIGCDQGTDAHLEGDAATHTALVFETIDAVARTRMGRAADPVEKLAVLLHDIAKPVTRTVLEGGGVSFPGHEAPGAEISLEVAKNLALSKEDADKLHYLVAQHGNAHEWPQLSAGIKNEITNSPWALSLGLLQEADARSCLLPGGGHLPVYWDEITALRRKSD